MKFLKIFDELRVDVVIKIFLIFFLFSNSFTKGTILKNYCKGLNKEGDLFWLMMDRNSIDFDAGVGKIIYKKGTGKFKKYEGTECVYAITFLSTGNGTFQKAKCKFLEKKN